MVSEREVSKLRNWIKGLPTRSTSFRVVPVGQDGAKKDRILDSVSDRSDIEFSGL